MSKIIYIVTDANYGALAFTTKKNALDYVFQDKKVLEIYDYEEKITRSNASNQLKNDYQVSFSNDRLGSVTITKTQLISKNERISD